MTSLVKQISVAAPEYQQLLALRDVVLRQPLGASVYDDDLSNDKEEHLFIALSGERVTACLMIRPLTGHRAKLRQMAVHPDFQGQGIGSALISSAERAAIAHGYKELLLHARKTAVPFYAKLGYEVVGEEFTEVGLPHLLMKKRLDEKTL